MDPAVQRAGGGGSQDRPMKLSGALDSFKFRKQTELTEHVVQDEQTLVKQKKY